MVKKIITWIDLEGRYRVTSPSYNDASRPAHETEEECLERVWARLVDSGVHGITLDHPHHYVEDVLQRAKLTECCGTEYRYAGMPDAHGKCDGRHGAWEMDADGTPKINMAKARGVHMDKIRVIRNAELVKLDVSYMIATEAGDVEGQDKIAGVKQTLRDLPATFDITTNITTPSQLRDAWPIELPAR